MKSFKKKIVQKIILASLVTVSAGLSTANAAASADVLGLTDSSIYGVIGLATTVTMDCKGVNMGIWRIGMNTPFTGSVTVTAANNLSATAGTATLVGTGISQTSASLPGTGYCKVTGLSAVPTVADYKMTLTNGTSNMGVATTAVISDVVNPTAMPTPASSTVSGLSFVSSMVSQTPAIDNTQDLYWRIAGVATFTSVSVTSTGQFGAHMSSPATVTISAP
jgi:hypothetical protein